MTMTKSSNVQSSQYMKLQARNTLPCYLWTKILSRMKLVMFIFISIMKPRTANLTSATLKTMKNMKLQQMHLMNGWILRNSTNQTLRSNSDTKREGEDLSRFFFYITDNQLSLRSCHRHIKSRRSSSISSSAVAFLYGQLPSFASITNTVSNSSPFAACIVIRFTPSFSPFFLFCSFSIFP